MLRRPNGRALFKPATVDEAVFWTFAHHAGAAPRTVNLSPGRGVGTGEAATERYPLMSAKPACLPTRGWRREPRVRNLSRRSSQREPTSRLAVAWFLSLGMGHSDTHRLHPIDIRVDDGAQLCFLIVQALRTVSLI